MIFNDRSSLEAKFEKEKKKSRFETNYNLQDETGFK